MSDNKFNLPNKSPAMPQRLGGDHQFKFDCYPGISCFNACCKRADITLTPYDIVRLKQHFKIDSSAFLKTYTVPFEMDADGMPGVKLKHTGETTECVFMTEAGCSVYENRPTSCRYYPMGQLSSRAADKNYDEIHYCKVVEDHCMGHKESKAQTIDEYRAGQKLEIYDEMNRQWQRIILKRKSAGPAVGSPSPTSFQFYFMALFDQDRFRQFIQTESFVKTYQLEEGYFAEILKDDTKCLQFAYRLLMQVLFGEENIELKKGAAKQRIQEREEIWTERKKAEEALHKQKQTEHNESLE